MESEFKFDKQVNAAVKLSFYHLRLLVKVKPFLSVKTSGQAVRTFISTRLDYCNALYTVIPESVILHVPAYS